MSASNRQICLRMFVRLAAKLPNVMHSSFESEGSFVADTKWEINATQSPANDLSNFGHTKTQRNLDSQ